MIQCFSMSTEELKASEQPSGIPLRKYQFRIQCSNHNTDTSLTSKDLIRYQRILEMLTMILTPRDQTVLKIAPAIQRQANAIRKDIINQNKTEVAKAMARKGLPHHSAKSHWFHHRTSTNSQRKRTNRQGFNHLSYRKEKVSYKCFHGTNPSFRCVRNSPVWQSLTELTPRKKN